MKKIASFLFCCLPLAVQGQTYTLRSCLETGLENNYSLRIVRNEEAMSKNNATRSNAEMWPT